MLENKVVCSLCSNKRGEFFHQDKKRKYYRCANCDLMFVPQNYYISSSQEKEQYDYHNNNPKDEGYRNFLNKLITPLKKHLKPGMSGLDFGSGPGPTLHLMLEEEGFNMKIWDPFYANDTKLLLEKYDFVTSSEVVEHFYEPKRSWKLLTGLVKKGGYLAIMTLRHDALRGSFANWWYKNDVTHVCFYSLKTLLWIQNHFNLKLSYYDERSFIFVRQ